MADGRSSRARTVVSLVLGVIVAFLPSLLKVPLYRLVYRYDIGRDVKIGLSPLIGVRRCRIGDGARIGHLNLFWDITNLDIGSHVRIGFLNVFRGGRLQLGAYVTVLRLNFVNSILEADAENVPDPVLEIGPGAVVTSGHRLDFTDRITIGASTVIGGRGSALWTHSRQRTRPIVIGNHCYLGSGVQVAPGVELADFCFVSLGAVLMGRYLEPRVLVLGNPARVERPLRAEELSLVTRRTRNDLPVDLGHIRVPEDLRALVDSTSTKPHADPG